MYDRDFPMKVPEINFVTDVSAGIGTRLPQRRMEFCGPGVSMLVVS